MTENDVQERKGIRRFQNVLVVAVFLLAAVAVRMLLIDEPQHWWKRRKTSHCRRFLKRELVRAEWLRQGKPGVVALFERADSPAGFIKVNEKDGRRLIMTVWFWEQVSGEIPASALSARKDENRCYFAINDKPWFWFDADQGRIQRENAGRHC